MASLAPRLVRPKLVRVQLAVGSLKAGAWQDLEAWVEGDPWLESVRAARPYWIVRSLSAVPIVAGFVLVILGLVTGPRGAAAMPPVSGNALRETY